MILLAKYRKVLEDLGRQQDILTIFEGSKE
jgi:hypothetical protein